MREKVFENFWGFFLHKTLHYKFSLDMLMNEMSNHEVGHCRNELIIERKLVQLELVLAKIWLAYQSRVQ